MLVLQMTGLHENINDFSVEYGVFSDFELHDIHVYLIKKWYCITCLGL